ncbi:MAG: hypothetical protein R3A52_24820 [Polyangiales bacterium]
MRFDPDADDLDAAREYFHARAVQGLMDGYRWEGAVEPLTEGDIAWGARTFAVDPEGARRQSVYVLASGRRGGRFSRYVAETEWPFVTGPHCELEDFFTRRGVPYVVAGRFTLTREYAAIARAFDDRRAARSGAHYMNHIDEGLAVLRWVGASERAMRAWCLHPFLQADETLAEWYPRVAELTDDPRVLALAMEYRNVANAYLSRREVRALDDIALGPLGEVHDMLRADKAQNAKDFILYHRATHPRREALERYFHLWHERLGITREVFARWFEGLQVKDVAPLPSDW